MYGGYSQNCGNVVESVTVKGRVSSAGAVVAPASVPRFTAAAGATGVYSVVFSEAYASFVGAQVTLEGASIPGSAATAGSVRYDWAAATRTLTVYVYRASDGAGLAQAFSFVAEFSESRAI